MIRFLHAVHCILLAAFAGPMADLDSPRFEERLRASKVLKRWTPVSLPAAYWVREHTESPEARMRAERVIREWQSGVMRGVGERVQPQ